MLSLTPGEFFSEFVSARKPVVLTGAADLDPGWHEEGRQALMSAPCTELYAAGDFPLIPVLLVRPSAFSLSLSLSVSVSAPVSARKPTALQHCRRWRYQR